MEKKTKLQEDIEKAQEQAKNFIKDVPCEQIIKNISFWLDVLINKGRYLDMEEAQAREKDNSNGMPSPDSDTE